jgi:drug/metabolite transporter (DMT)-like permease
MRLSLLLLVALSCYCQHSIAFSTNQRTRHVNAKQENYCPLIINRSPCARLSAASHDANERAKSRGWLSLSDRAKGVAVLMTVPVAWGTYVPVVRYLYEIQPAVPGFVFSASYYAVASVTTLTIVAWQDKARRRTDKENPTTSSTTSMIADDQRNAKVPFPILGGIELGIYLFLGNCLQVVGLKTVSSDRAGFLVQLTTVMVPILEAILGGNILTVPARTWLSCLLAFMGICVMNLDGITGASSITSIMAGFKTFSQGDVLILASAVLYTLHVVRLGLYAKETTPMKLAASKATIETILSTGLVVALLSLAGTPGLPSFLQDSATEISNFFSTITKNIATGAISQSAILSALGATLWTGLVTCAYTIFAQSFGQTRVGPTEANLIYSIQPICTALFAFLLLGETMGPAGVVGGAFIGGAVYLVTTTGDSPNKNDNTVDGEDGQQVLIDSPQLERMLNRTGVLVNN